MILILGSNHDDILYFESIMTGKKEETLYGRFKVRQGNIFNQEVTLVDGVDSSILSSAIVLDLARRYYAILVISVGRCIAVSPDWKLGDIAISSSTIAGDVDLMSESDARLGQIPGLSERFYSQKDILAYIKQAMEKRTFGDYREATFVSMNSTFLKKEQLRGYGYDGNLFGESRAVVIDTSAAGCAAACELLSVPFVAVKVVSRFLDKPYSVRDYGETIERYVDVGRALATVIGDIGRQDLLEGD